MPKRKTKRKTRRSRTKADEYEFLSFRVDDYKVRASAGINYYAYYPQNAFGSTQNEPLITFVTHLEIHATATDPKDRAGVPGALTVYNRNQS